MAERPAVKTPTVTRPELEAIFKSPALVRAFEALLRDVATVLPDAAEDMSLDVEAAQAAADAAQSTADDAEAAAFNAQASADNAQTSANAAQVDVDALGLVPFIVVAPDPAATEARALAVSAGLTINDSGPGGSITVGLDRDVEILPSDVSDTTGVLVDAVGLLIPLEANSVYAIDGLITFQSAALTTGIALALTLPAGASISGGYQHNVSANMLEGSYNIASGAVKGNTSGVLVINENVPITGRWLITTSATPGDAQLQFRTAVALSSVTLKAGLSVLTSNRLE